LTNSMAICPLDIPEIRVHISRYLSKKDYILCSLVSRDWNATFADLLYHTVAIRPFNFSGKAWKNPSPESLTRYGDSIRNLSFSGLVPLRLLSFPGCARLERLSLDTDWFSDWNRRLMDRLNDHETEQPLDSEQRGKARDNKAIHEENEQELEFWDPVFPELFSSALSDLLARNQQHLNTIRLYDQTRLTPEFWTTISNCPKVKTLDVFRCLVQKSDMPMFWAACTTHVKTLHLNFSKLAVDLSNPRADQGQRQAIVVDSVASSLPLMVEFPTLERITIETMPTLSAHTQMQLVMQCPNLKAFRWRLVDRMPNEIEALQRLMINRACPLLEELSLNAADLPDELLTLILEGIAPSKVLELNWSGFGKDAHFQLMCRHAETIRELSLYNCRGVTSLMTLDILSSCPVLESFVGTVIEASDMIPTLLLEKDAAEDDSDVEIDKDIDKSQEQHYAKVLTDSLQNLSLDGSSTNSANNDGDGGDDGDDDDKYDEELESLEFLEGGAKNWVCTRIKVLKVYFSFTEVTAIPDFWTQRLVMKQPHSIKVHPQKKFDREHQIVLRQLCRLGDLRRLEMVPPQYQFGHAKGIDLRLKCRGGHLETLAKSLPKLDTINLSKPHQDMTTMEVEWIARHWPSLTTIMGSFCKDQTLNRNLHLLFARNQALAEAANSDRNQQSGASQ
ncbi:hypothetical protein BGZ83_010412, partial [Gryganskiella cystojenkinii]